MVKVTPEQRLCVRKTPFPSSSSKTAPSDSEIKGGHLDRHTYHEGDKVYSPMNSGFVVSYLKHSNINIVRVNFQTRM